MLIYFEDQHSWLYYQYEREWRNQNSKIEHPQYSTLGDFDALSGSGKLLRLLFNTQRLLTSQLHILDPLEARAHELVITSRCPCP
jgi:hypothetical protein